MKSLTSLRVSGEYDKPMRAFRSLPQRIGELTNLRTLDLRHISRLQFLPEGIPCSNRLRRIERCITVAPTLYRFVSSPLSEGLGQLTNLEKLNLVECMSLVSLPEGSLHS